TGAEWYPGRPVLVTRNDPALRLANGDVGVALPDPAADGALRVFFPAPDGGVRAVPPLRLPGCETAYALTVHKSQGSEFDRVLLVLGDRPTRALTRELVYTGLTRARRHAEVWAAEAAFLAACHARATRASGLRDALWG
ncbi:MAG: ATP-binding domain-containing protein, partial [Deferrisomatales bacterium]